MVRLRVPVAPASRLAPGKSAKFSWRAGLYERHGFIVNYRGTLHAFVNECAHIPTALDWFENEFFDDDYRYLVCAWHGARYEPDSGRCVSGPPCGASLEPLRAVVEGEEVVVYVEAPEGGA